MNKQLIIGNVGKDPVVANGRINFSVAVSKRWKDKASGEAKEQTEWFNVVVWGKYSETLGPILKKGQKVYVEGETQTSVYEKDGVKKDSKSVNASTVQILSPREKEGAAEFGDI
jgi:single-strand DNA-binding protein